MSCDLYSNLVTRPTGAAVRGQIERLLDDAHERTLTVIDFSQVSMIDFSCADEVIAKLLMRYEADDPPRDAYFLFRGVTDEHWDAIEAVLERHGLALVLEQADGVHVVGTLERRRAPRVGGTCDSSAARAPPTLRSALEVSRDRATQRGARRAAAAPSRYARRATSTSSWERTVSDDTLNRPLRVSRLLATQRARRRARSDGVHASRERA